MCRKVKFPLPDNNSGLVVMECKEDRVCYEIPKGRGYSDEFDEMEFRRFPLPSEVSLDSKYLCGVISFGDELEMKHSIKKDKLDLFLKYVSRVIGSVIYIRYGFLDELSKYICGVNPKGRRVKVFVDNELKYHIIVDDDNFKKLLIGFGYSLEFVKEYFEINNER